MLEKDSVSQHMLLDEWHSVCYDVPIEDKIHVADKWLNSLLGLHPSDDASSIEFIREPGSGAPHKTVVDSESLHRLQFLAIQGLTRLFPDSMTPTDVLKSLSHAVEPTKSVVPSQPLTQKFPEAKEASTNSLGNVIVSGIQLSVTQVPFIIGSDAAACHFAVTPELVTDNSKIAGIHCVFQRRGRCWMIENVSECAIVLVDGEVVPNMGAAEVFPGSVVILGPGTISFTLFPNFS